VNAPGHGDGSLTGDAERRSASVPTAGASVRIARVSTVDRSAEQQPGPDRRAALLAAPPLPAGKHGLSRAYVVEHQRGRILAALVESTGRVGYGSTGLAEITKLAGLSRRAFYDHFATKDDACLCACDVEVERLVSALLSSVVGARDLDAAVRRALGLVLDRLAGDPAVAQLLVVEPLRNGTPLAERRDRYLRELAELLEGAVEAFGRGPLPRLTAPALVAAAYDAIYHVLTTSSAAQLPELLDELHWLFARQLLPDADAAPSSTRTTATDRAPGSSAALARYRIVLEQVHAESGALLRDAPTWQAGLYAAVRACYSRMRSNPEALHMHFIATATDERVQRIRTRHRNRLLDLLLAVRDDVPDRAHAEVMLRMIHSTVRAHIQAHEAPPELDEAEQTFARLLFNTTLED